MRRPPILVDALLARGDTVRIVDDLSTGRLDNLADARDRVELIEGDLCDPATLRPALGLGGLALGLLLATAASVLFRTWGSGSDLSLVGMYQLLGWALALAAAGPLAKQLDEYLERGQPLGQGVSVRAVRGGDIVLGRQRAAHAHG